MKRDIRPVAIGELGSLYELLRGIQLSTYAYKDAPATSPRRLGFIIDDTEAPAAINPDGNSVDLYGYLSMAVAAIQVQAKEIENLKVRIQTMELQKIQGDHVKARLVGSNRKQSR